MSQKHRDGLSNSVTKLLGSPFVQKADGCTEKKVKDELTNLGIYFWAITVGSEWGCHVFYKIPRCF